MIDSYKNIERLRYRINKDIVSIYRDIKEYRSEQNLKLIDEHFAAIVSSMAALFLTQETFCPLKMQISRICILIFGYQIPNYFVDTIALIIGVILLLIIAYIINICINQIKRLKKRKKPEGVDTIDYVKEFDNIACDSIFVSIEYRDAYYNTNDKNEQKLFLFEIIHCLESACEITKKLCGDKNNIKNSNNVVGVDVYRIHNIKDIMCDLYEFINTEMGKICIDELDMYVLEKKLNEIQRNLKCIDIVK